MLLSRRKANEGRSNRAARPKAAWLPCQPRVKLVPQIEARQWFAGSTEQRSAIPCCTRIWSATKRSSAPRTADLGLTLGGVFIFVGLTRALFGHSHAIWWLTAGLVLVVLAAVWPAGLGPFNRLWLKFGLLLYKFVNPVVMTLLYVSTIVPIGVAMRLSGKDPLLLKPSPDAETYWIVSDPRGSRPENMKNQF